MRPLRAEEFHFGELLLQAFEQRGDHNVLGAEMPRGDQRDAEGLGVRQLVVLRFARHEGLAAAFGRLVEILAARAAAQPHARNCAPAVGVEQPAAAEGGLHELRELPRRVLLRGLAQQSLREAAGFLQRADAAQAQPLRKAVVDPAGGEVQIRVRADGRDAGLREQIRRRARPQRAQRMENHRMVADDQLRGTLRSLPHDVRRDVEGKQGPAHGRFLRPRQQAAVVEIHRGAERREAVDQPVNIPHGRQIRFLLSIRSRCRAALICARASSSFSASAVRPRRRAPNARFLSSRICRRR